MSVQRTALVYEVEVDENGRVEFSVPYPKGSVVSVVVLDGNNDMAGLLRASESSLGFWDNPLDDEDWNDA
ncbi:MAG: hypothetical protein KY476_16125 [Planctomycetes bacterium]|nr:hypothetical protein [Planctomycetota bacterium]